MHVLRAPLTLAVLLGLGCSTVAPNVDAALHSDLPQGDLGYFSGTGPCLQEPGAQMFAVLVSMTHSADAEQFSLQRAEDGYFMPPDRPGTPPIAPKFSTSRTNLRGHIVEMMRGNAEFCVVLRPDQRLTVADVYEVGLDLQNTPGAVVLLFPELASGE